MLFKCEMIWVWAHLKGPAQLTPSGKKSIEGLIEWLMGKQAPMKLPASRKPFFFHSAWYRVPSETLGSILVCKRVWWLWIMFVSVTFVRLMSPTVGSAGWKRLMNKSWIISHKFVRPNENVICLLNKRSLLLLLVTEVDITRLNWWKQDKHTEA